MRITIGSTLGCDRTGRSGILRSAAEARAATDRRRRRRWPPPCRRRRRRRRWPRLPRHLLRGPCGRRVVPHAVALRACIFRVRHTAASPIRTGASNRRAERRASAVNLPLPDASSPAASGFRIIRADDGAGPVRPRRSAVPGPAPASAGTTPRPAPAGLEYRVHARRRIVQLARLCRVQLARDKMQIRHVTDRRLRLVRHKFDTMRLRQRGAPCQTGDAAHFYDIRLDHADAGGDQIRQPRQRIGLLAGRDCNIETARHLAHRANMVVLHRLLEPPIAESSSARPTRIAPPTE